MVLGVDELLMRVKKGELVRGLAERELTNPEGCGFDLRIGEAFKIQGEGFLGVTERKTPEPVSVAVFDERKTASLVLKPGDYYLVKTIETINLPVDIVGVLFTRGTLFRSGIIHGLSQIAPGYQGELVTSLYNAGPARVEIEMGSRFMHVQFSRVEGGGSKYRGQWRGGRVAAIKLEKQV